VLKTTQSAFADFHKCAYTTLSDVNDRLFSTTVSAEWKYDSLNGLRFCHAWLVTNPLSCPMYTQLLCPAYWPSTINLHSAFRNTVRDTIMEVFAGPSDHGVFSPSVQLTLYDTEKLALARIPQVSAAGSLKAMFHPFQ